jgi:hypothetical protein
MRRWVPILVCVSCQTGGSAVPRGGSPERATAPTTTPTTSDEVPDAAEAPKLTSSESCAPPRLDERDPPPAARTLEGLLALLEDPSAALRHVERDFGKTKPSQTHSTSYELAAPLPGVERVTIGWHRAQNREYLRRVEVDFDSQNPPTVLALAKRVGLERRVGKDPVKSSCTDAACPSVSFERGDDGAMIFYLPDSATSALGSRNVARLPVRRLFAFLPKGGCGIGTVQAEPTPLPDPAAGPARDFAQATLGAARELAKPTVDQTRIETSLSPFGRVKFEHNSMSKFTWVRVFLEKDKRVPPICFSGFRYLQERDLICHIHDDDKHVYETEGTPSHRLFLSVSLDGPLNGPVDHVSSIELELQPRDWPHTVF